MGAGTRVDPQSSREQPCAIGQPAAGLPQAARRRHGQACPPDQPRERRSSSDAWPIDTSACIQQAPSCAGGPRTPRPCRLRAQAARPFQRLGLSPDGQPFHLAICDVRLVTALRP
jgi:hypothetical protein